MEGFETVFKTMDGLLAFGFAAWLVTVGLQMVKQMYADNRADYQQLLGILQKANTEQRETIVKLCTGSKRTDNPDRP